MDSSLPIEFDEFRITYGEGVTDTEKLLKYLGEISFFRFWSHANPHIAPGKELGDLLVICGNYVIIFSDKGVNYSIRRGVEIGWRQWYREAIKDSVRQLTVAAGRLLQKRIPIYKDNRATVVFGLPLPSLESAQLYLVAVVNNSRTIDDTKPLQPFLTFDSSIVGDQHVAAGATPFLIGDVSPSAHFVHVIDIAGLQEVLKRLDTVTDFVRYLDAREGFLRANACNTAANELCMITRFLFSFTPAGDPLPLDAGFPGFTRLSDGERLAASTISDLEARDEANQVSYLWDDLIARQADSIETRSFAYTTYHTPEEGEEVVRHMALEPRLKRRILSDAWREACFTAAEGQTHNLRTVPHGVDSKTTYFFLTAAPYPKESEDDYRLRRLRMLEDLALAPIHEYPETEIVIGFASELGQVPDSRDHLYYNALTDPGRDTLAEDAKASWEYKRFIFQTRKRSEGIVRDVPPG